MCIFARREVHKKGGPKPAIPRHSLFDVTFRKQETGLKIISARIIANIVTIFKDSFSFPEKTGT
jgi:hypothetical protein